MELPDGYRILIDGGGFSSNAFFDVGENVVAPYLWGKKIGRLDTVVLSHPDADHLNGLLYILEHFRVKQVYSTHQATKSRAYKKFREIIEKKSISHPSFERMPRRFRIKGVIFDILHPPEDAHPIASADNTNNHSLVIRASFRGHSMLFPGDIMAEAEKEILKSQEKSLSATVLAAPHHGSRSSSTEKFLEAVDPKAVIVSAGLKNRFSLPAPSVMERYLDRGCRIFVTNRNGAVEVCIQEKRMEVVPTMGKAVVLR
jgi:competence protein ComEC